MRKIPSGGRIVRLADMMPMGTTLVRVITAVTPMGVMTAVTYVTILVMGITMVSLLGEIVTVVTASAGVLFRIMTLVRVLGHNTEGLPSFTQPLYN